MTIPRVDVLGVGISVINMETAAAEISRWIVDGERHYVCVTGVHGVMESQRDPDLMRIHNASGLTTPDGMPMVWSGRWAGAASMSRVYGPDLMLEVCRISAERGWRNYLFGGKPGVVEDLANRLIERFPGLNVCGTLTPPFHPLDNAEKEEIVAAIREADPHIIWVGLSTPKQEKWMAEFIDRLGVPVLVGVGAAFDIHAGKVTQAPLWMRNSGLEWLYRLSKEPRRLWKRYFLNNPAFIANVARRPPRLINDVSVSSFETAHGAERSHGATRVEE